MLESFPDDYRELVNGMKGPKEDSDATDAVLGDEGDPEFYKDGGWDDNFRWYRYLFLGRGKPTTHLRVLGDIDADRLSTDAPDELIALVDLVKNEILPDADTDN